jgi:hypothetical protein
VARGPSKVRQSDLTKALRAFRYSGLAVTSVEIDSETGKITIRSGAPIDANEDVATLAMKKWLAENKEED